MKIILDYKSDFSRSWSWRSEWQTGYDSSYGLLSKFAVLNALCAIDLARVFAVPQNQNSAYFEDYSEPDLCDSEFFMLEQFAKIFHRGPNELNGIFLFAQIPNSRLRASTDLRWCERCLEFGTHFSIMQHKSLACCPIHGSRLRTVCVQCNKSIPYRLSSRVFLRPFHCPTCNLNLAPHLRRVESQNNLDGNLYKSALNNAIKNLLHESSVVRNKLEFSDNMQQIGKAPYVTPHVDEAGYHSRYTGFSEAVLSRLVDEPCAQTELLLEPVDATTIGRFDKIVNLNTKKTERSPDTPKNRALANADEHDVRELYVIYSSVRRHIWRHVISYHQRCFHNAANHLWWRVSGERLIRFCGAAEAFIQWRMLWEGPLPPRKFNTSMSNPPIGIINWVAGKHPPCPLEWTPGTRQAILNHICANVCIDTFREKLKRASPYRADDPEFWSPERDARFDCFWAVGGSNTPQDPARVFVRAPMSMAGCQYVFRKPARRHYLSNDTFVRRNAR
jgi:hypothetical protein